MCMVTLRIPITDASEKGSTHGFRALKPQTPLKDCTPSFARLRRSSVQQQQLGQQDGLQRLFVLAGRPSQGTLYGIEGCSDNSMNSAIESFHSAILNKQKYAPVRVLVVMVSAPF